MAGIGFRLKKLLDQDSYTSNFKAYFFGALISTGPWMITILVLALIGLFEFKEFSLEKLGLFRVAVTYVFAMSLVFVGIIQMPLTRYLADMLYGRKVDDYLPTYVAALIVTAGAVAVVGIPFWFYFSGLTLAFAFQTYMLFLVVSLVWVAMIFVSTAFDYSTISWAFVFGGLLSLGCAYYLGNVMGVVGLMRGFVVGQVFIFLVLTLRLFIEFSTTSRINFAFLAYLSKYPYLLLVGILYNLAIWVDKLIFWLSPYGEHVQGILYACKVYDVPIFLSYITIVPAMSYFLVKSETDFYVYYKDYYSAIISKQNFRTVLAIKKRLINNVSSNMIQLVKIQGFVSLICIILAPHIISLLRLDWVTLGILRVGILAAFLNVLLLLQIIFLLYFEMRAEVFILGVLFFVLNTVGTYLSVQLGIAFFGYGYLASVFISLVVGIIIMDSRVRNLEYITFTKQPVQTPIT